MTQATQLPSLLRDVQSIYRRLAALEATPDAGQGLGLLGHASLSTNSSTFTTTETALGLSVTVTVAVARVIKLTVRTHISSTVTGDAISVYVRRDGALIDSNSYASLANVVTAQSFVGTDEQPVVGSHTYSVSAARSSGTGTLQNNGGSAVGSILLVEDVGAY